MNNILGKCPLCGRDMIDGPSVDEHHLIPRTFKGSEKVLIHRVCHRKIHSCLAERELFNYYNTIERLLEHEEIRKFVKWVRKKDPEYYDTSKETKARKSKRRK